MVQQFIFSARSQAIAVSFVWYVKYILDGFCNANSMPNKSLSSCILSSFIASMQQAGRSAEGPLEIEDFGTT